MKFLVDANIILDVLEDRPYLADSSSLIWKLCETQQAVGYVSTLTFADLVYIMRKELNPEQISIIYDKLSNIFQFVDLTVSDLSRASKMQWKDYEDAVQSATAKRFDADYIITRNIRDFLKSDIPALTPEELLLKVQQ